MHQLGFALRHELGFGAGDMVPLATFLEGIRAGHYSYTWNIPAAIQAECLPQLESWASTTFDVEAVPMPREIVWKVYQKT